MQYFTAVIPYNGTVKLHKILKFKRLPDVLDKILKQYNLNKADEK